MFGFWSYLYLTERGKEINVTISTHVDVNYVWLEALSFGKAAFGHVSVESESGVIISDAEQIVWPELPEEENPAGVYETELLIDGVSPYGNWREGDIGVWQTPKSSDDAYNSFSFSVTVPEDRDALVQIWDFIMLTANRHHSWRTDRCNAECDRGRFFDTLIHQIELHQLELKERINENYANVLDIDIFTIKPRAYILIGRSDGWRKKKKEALRKLNYSLHGIEVLSYTDLLQRGNNLISLYTRKFE